MFLNSAAMAGCVLFYFQGVASLHNNEKKQGDEDPWPITSTHASRMTPTTGQSGRMYIISISTFLLLKAHSITGTSSILYVLACIYVTLYVIRLSDTELNYLLDGKDNQIFTQS